jgi:CheY-like chemotaxis protein
MVRRFAEQADGALQIESREGEGTTVTVWLPRTEQLAETTANMTLPLSTLPGGEERLLLVSRDRDARVAMQQILEALGYSVVATDSPESVDALMAGVPAPAVVISERSAAAARTERRWLDSLRENNAGVRHIALLQAGADVEAEAPDADGHVYRPVTVVELARAIRLALEKQ